MKRLLQLILFIPFLIFAQPDSDGVYFNGVNNSIIMPNTNNINKRVVNNRTYEMYFKAKSIASRQILMKEGGTSRAILAYIENNYLVIGGYNKADYNPKWGGTFYRIPINAEEWYHIALVIDNANPGDSVSNKMEPNANKSLKFYLDGELIAEQSGYELGSHSSLKLGYKTEELLFPDCSSWTLSTTGLSEYCFGSTVKGIKTNKCYFKGNIWGFRIWDLARTKEEINKYKETIVVYSPQMSLLAVLDGDTLSFMSDDDDGIEFTSLKKQVVRTWKVSAGSSNWNEASNWESGNIPDPEKLESALIPAGASYYPKIETHIKVGDITLEFDVVMEIKETGTLDVHYDLLSEGQIKVENNGSLLIREGELDKNECEKGEVLLDRTTPAYPEDYYSFWSSPMLENQSRVGNFFTNKIRAFRWDASQQPAKYVEIDENYVMEPGVGYSIRSDVDAGPITRTFSSHVNNGDIRTPIYDYANSEDYSLIGNPYSSALNWEAVYNDNDDLVNGTIYFWKQTYMGTKTLESDFIPYNLTGSNVPGVTGYIGSGQGVFVEAINEGEIVYKNCHRVAGNNSQFFKLSKKKGENKLWLRLSSEKRGYSNALLAYLPKATNGFDHGYDGNVLDSGVLSLYSVLDGKKLAIQAKESLRNKEEETVDLGFEAVTAGNYSISILKSLFNEEYDVFLEDKVLNTYTNLKVEEYNFSVENPVIDVSRFLLHIKKGGVLSTADNGFKKHFLKSYFKNNTLYTKVINEDLVINTIEIHDISGKLVLSANFKSSMPLKVTPGVYLIKYISKASGVLFNKMIFK